MKPCPVVIAMSAVLLCSCSGGGGDGGVGEGGSGAKSSCQTIGPNVNFAVVAGGVDNLQDAADGKLSTFATFTALGAGSYISSKGIQFPGGSNAGVFLTPPSGTTAADITVSTFLDQEQAIIESATGPTLTIAPTQGTPATEYASFTTTAPFNGVRLTVNTPNNDSFLVFEICGTGQ